MRYTIVTLIILGFCFTGIVLDRHSSGNQSRNLNASLTNGKQPLEITLKSGADVGNMSCAEAHALIRMKKNDESLRSGIWQLENQRQCPVLSSEAYLALQR